MARAGMTRWRSRNCAPVSDGCDEVQKSLDLLDRVLSEFDDCENGASGEPTPEKSLLPSSSVEDAVVEQITSLKSCSTPEDESPSGFSGHQSEDDGYMSMNGRKARLLMTSSSTSSSNDFSNGDENGVTTPRTPPPVTSRPTFHSGLRLNGDFPPPPEEAERIISTLLPRVSPCSSSQRSHKSGKKFLNNVALSLEEDARVDKFGRSTTATQTTLPKTKHQRPYGWQKEVRHQQRHSPSASNGVPRTCSKYGSLPYDGVSYPENYLPPWLQRSGNQVPPRTVPTVLDRHREVRRCVEDEDSAAMPLNPVEETVDEDPANFSDDSLEDVPPPPPPAPQQSANKRSSIAWEVSLDSENEALLIPGSTKVVGRRRRKSTDHSSNGSLTALSIYDDWPEPPNGTDDSLSCLTSDTELDITADLHAFNEANKKSNVQCGTYVIRRGSKKDRIQLSEMRTPTDSRVPKSPLFCNGDTDLKRCSSTFDNIKSLLKEGLVEGLDDSPPDFHPPKPPALSRGLSLPSILNDSIFGGVDNSRTSKRSSFVADSRPSDDSQSSLELLGLSKTPSAAKLTVSSVERGRSTPHNYVSKCIWTGSDQEDDRVEPTVEKQSVAVQVSADFTLLNKEIAEQSAGCQTDNEELNYCVHKAVNTAENITSTSTFQRRQSKNDDLDRREQPSENEVHHAAESLVTPGENVDQDVPDGYSRLKEQPTDSSIEDLLVYEAKCEKEDEIEERVQRRQQLPEKRQPQPPQKVLKAEEQSLGDNSWSASRPLPNVRKVMPPLKTGSQGHRNICNGRLQEPPGDFKVNVEILNHEFGPLPPSPVEEVEDEYSDILHSVPTNRKSDSLNIESVYRRNSRISASGSIRSNRAPEIPPHRDYSNSSLKTRSVDAGFTRNHRTQLVGSRKDVPVERRTLPTDLPGTSHRRPYQKRGSQSPKDENAQVSCSLPETPIFARGCDIPRTPLRNTTDKSNSSRTTPRLNGIQTSGYARNVGAGHGTSLGEVMAGAELLRLTGPGRGWYPRHRQPRPASVEHLDRLTPQGLSPSAPTVGAWEARDSRKPLTLPPNLSPKFFQRSPREALRRVTSLLIRKGGNTKDTKSKDVLASSVIGPHGDFGETSRQQKRGFFRSFWKRSRHYSLDQQ